MRILQIIDSMHAGGAERMCVNISNVLKQDGHEVTLCASREKGPLEKFIYPGIKVLTLNKKSAYDIIAFYRLLAYVKMEQVELIHAHSSSVIWAIGVKFIRPSTKIVWHDHYGLSENLKDTDRKGIKLISHFIDGIIAVNDTLREWSVRNMRVSSKSIVVINNFPLLPERSAQKTPGLTTIVCLANLRPQKDHPTLVRAISILREDQPELKLNVIFAGLYWKDVYYNNLLSLINSLGLNDTINIAGSVEDTASLLASADIGVLSSVSEGLPVSLLEYGLAGLPVVVTDVGQCSEVLSKGRFGKLVTPGNAELFANSLKELVNNPLDARKTGFEFCDYINKNYGSQNFVLKYYKLISSI